MKELHEMKLNMKIMDDDDVNDNNDNNNNNTIVMNVNGVVDRELFRMREEMLRGCVGLDL